VDAVNPPSRGGRPAVTAVVVNWNGRDYLPRCIQALRASTIPVRIVVVDNASSDGSAGWLRAEEPDVELVALDENTGYAAGANAGLRVSDSEFAIVLNPDVALAPDHLETLAARMEADPEIGVAQGKLYRAEKDDFVAGRLAPGGPIDSAGHAVRATGFVVDRGQGEPDGPAFDVEREVFSACGAALFLRRRMLRELSGEGEWFDEAFFAYKEDIDLCWRARLLGWKVLYVPSAIAYHVRGWAGSRLPDRDRVPVAARRHSWKNHYLLLLKNETPRDLLRTLPAVAGWEVLRLGYAALKDRALFAAYGDLLRLLPRALRQRRDVMRRRRGRGAALARWLREG
jgi:GT2 family glycosyltransferase